MLILLINAIIIKIHISCKETALCCLEKTFALIKRTQNGWRKMVAPETTNKEMKNRQIRRVDRYSAISIIIVDMR